MTRFNVMANAICQPGEQIVHLAIAFGIKRKTEFYRELKKIPTQDMGDFYFQEDKYIHLEDANIEA